MCGSRGERREGFGGARARARRPHTHTPALPPSSLFDVYRLNYTTGNLTVDTVNPGDVASWVPDKFLRVRGAKALRPAGGGVLRVRTVGRGRGDAFDAAAPDDGPATGEWVGVAEWGAADTFLPVTSPGHSFAFTDAGASVYVLTSVGGDYVRLVKVPTVAGKEWTNLSDAVADADVVDVAFDDSTGALVAVATDRARRRWVPLNAEAEKNSAVIRAAFNGSDDYTVASASSGRAILRLISDVAPPSYHLFDVGAGIVTRTVDELPALVGVQLCPMQAVTPAARDGSPLPSYLTLPPLPPTWNATGTGGRLPLLIAVRAAPWLRDFWGFHPTTQTLANRGYAVLQVNFRGSSGFGRKWVAAGAGEWGKGMTTDLVDAAAWAVAQGIADPARVSIFGFSYGGYAALDAVSTQAASVTGCAASLGGAARLESARLLNPPGYVPSPAPRPGSREAREDKDAARAVSPLTHVDSVRVPVFQAVGAQDDAALVSAAREFNAALKGRGIRTEFVEYPDDGATLRTDDDRVDFASRLNQFLASCAGGRAAQPVEVEGLRVTVVDGPADAPERRRVKMSSRPTPYSTA